MNQTPEDALAAFLKARYDEDETAVRSAKPGPWHSDGGSVYATHPTDAVVDYTEGSADHIARHDPARVLADIEAKRRIVYAYEFAATDPVESGFLEGEESTLQFVLELLALPYTDHPDYRQEWRP